MKFLLVCSQGELEEFRLPELESIATLFGFPLTYDDPKPDISRPYMVVHLPGEREARLLGSRSIAVKHIWQHWGDADSYENLHEELQKKPEEWLPYRLFSTWKFMVATFARTIPLPDQVAVIESFRYMDFLGPITLKNPELEVGVFEEYVRSGKKRNALERGRELGEMRRVWVGRKICDTQRHMMDVFDLKKRAYIGNTSMESEVSLLMANQALASPGKLVYDPFAGTGSMLLTSSAFGALSFGSDIDGRQLRGKTTSITHSADQYGIRDRILDCAVFDLAQHPFRTGEIFDAIITDPPYGVRAGAKRLGRKPDDPRSQEDYMPKKVPGSDVFPYEMPDYVPPSHPWEMSSVITSLLSFSLYLLKPHGRLVFFLPTASEEYADVDIPVVPGLRLVSNSSQDFGKWARRLITMEKVPLGQDELVDELDRGIRRMGMGELEGEQRKPGHADFRDKYFRHFVTPTTTPPPEAAA